MKKRILIKIIIKWQKEMQLISLTSNIIYDIIPLSAVKQIKIYFIVGRYVFI